MATGTIMARRKTLDYKITETELTVSRLVYPNGPDGDSEVAETRVFALSEVPEKLLVSGEGEDATFTSVAAYGLSQLLQDRASQAEGEEAKLEKMEETFALLKDGKWKAVRSTGEGGKRAAVAADFAEAFARYVQSKGKDMDATTATVWLQSKTADERKAIRAMDEVKAFIQQVKDEAIAKAGNLELDDLLA